MNRVSSGELRGRRETISIGVVNARRGYPLVNEAIQECFRKYAVFEGRTTRRIYWFFYLFGTIIVFIASFSSSAFIANAAYLMVLLPLISAGVRRMHDVGKSGWFLLVPIYSLILLCMPSVGYNKYGPSPDFL